MHGGAAGSGAPLGNQNARKHGTYTKVAFSQRALVRQLIKGVVKQKRTIS
jgi:glucans biosynthesis protein